MHDPLSSADLACDELRQRRESGYDVDHVAAGLARTSPDDEAALEVVYQALLGTRRQSGWPYTEPNALDDILAAMPAVSSPPGQAAVDPDRLADRILGGWLGRIAGCNLGKPVEDGDFWTPERVRSYLELADAYPLRDYIPALDPMPADYRFQDCWLETTRGRIAGSARDDDIDYAIIAAWLLEQYGHNLDRSDVAAAMLAFLPTCGCRRTRRDGEPPASGASGAGRRGSQPIPGVDRCADQSRRVRVDKSRPTRGCHSAGLRRRHTHAPKQWCLMGRCLGLSRVYCHLQDRTRSAVFGYDHSRISDLATRTVRLAEKGLPSRRSRVRS